MPDFRDVNIPVAEDTLFVEAVAWPISKKAVEKKENLFRRLVHQSRKYLINFPFLPASLWSTIIRDGVVLSFLKIPTVNGKIMGDDSE